MVSTPPAPVATAAERAQGARTTVRPEIQGLRAIAVMLVVLFHLWPTRLTGGYVGVDVFFAISGFLITAHLLREVERTGRISLSRFWARRARRLLPAALLVLAASVVATLVWVPSALWDQFLREAAAAGLYVLNWVLARDAVDYFAADNVASPSQHYWSLSVEEQFYLVWPLLIVLALWLAVRLSRHRLVVTGWTLGVVSVASLAWSVHLTGLDPAAAYFVTPARAWQFGLGALLAVLGAHGSASGTLARCPRVRAAASWLGLVLIGFAAVSYTDTTPFPGSAALVPVTGALLVMAAQAPPVAWSPVRLLGLRPVQTLGDVSYSAYLWHWPPIVILPFALGRDLDTPTKLVLLAAVLAAAWLSKRYVEDPVRSTTRFHLRLPAVTFAWTAVAMALLVAGCTAGTQAGHRAERTAVVQETKVATEEVDCFGAASMDPDKPTCPTPELADVVVPDPSRISKDTAGHGECWVGNDDARLTSCHFPDSGEPASDVPHIALVGDSHARAWLPAFVELAAQGKVTLDTYLKGSCTWSTTPPDRNSATFSRTCRDWREDLEARLIEDPDAYDVVVTAGFSQQKIDVPASADPEQARVDGLLEAWQPALAAGVHIVALRDNPIPGEPTGECLQRAGRDDHSRCDIPRSTALGQPDPQVEAVDEAGDGVRLVDLTDFYCDERTCPAVIGGVNVYRDGHHVSATYITTLAPYLWRELSADIDALG